MVRFLGRLALAAHLPIAPHKPFGRSLSSFLLQYIQYANITRHRVLVEAYDSPCPDLLLLGTGDA